VPVFAAPSVRTFAREIGVNVRDVQGSGPGGRISIDDVKRHARDVQAGGGAPQQAGARNAPLPDFSRWGDVKRIDMGGVRRRTAEHVSLAWSTMPHVTLFEKADSTDLESARQRYKEGVEKKAGVRLTLTAMLLKIVASGLKAHPELAASADVTKNQIVRKGYCHLGVAVDTPRGLLVPVLRDVDRKSITQISGELDDLAGKARDGKLKLNDMNGGVFTLTNLGGLGTGFFTPIINFPEGAVLGVGRATMEPVYDEDSGDFKPRLMMPLSLSFDHRLIDGADGARFLHWLVQAIEDPILMAL
jgi:pyruvate dehydrogenase E2 component (dihydrolipoamide acetyltransferase)